MALVVLVCAALPARAAVTTYTDRTAFLNALGSAPTTTIDFDSTAAGTVITNGSPFAGVVFDYSDPTYDLVVLDGLDTTSSPNFLGVDDSTTTGFFFPEDLLTLTFPTPVRAVGGFFVTPAGILDGVLHLTTGAGTANSGLLPTATLPSGDEAWFVGLIADSPVTTATFTSDFTVLVYNLDDITYAPVPEPMSATLVVMGLAGMACRRHAREPRGDTTATP